MPTREEEIEAIIKARQRVRKFAAVADGNADVIEKLIADEVRRQIDERFGPRAGSATPEPR